MKILLEQKLEHAKWQICLSAPRIIVHMSPYIWYINKARTKQCSCFLIECVDRSFPPICALVSTSSFLACLRYLDRTNHQNPPCPVSFWSPVFCLLVTAVRVWRMARSVWLMSLLQKMWPIIKLIGQLLHLLLICWPVTVLLLFVVWWLCVLNFYHCQLNCKFKNGLLVILSEVQNFKLLL